MDRPSIFGSATKRQLGCPSGPGSGGTRSQNSAKSSASKALSSDSIGTPWRHLAEAAGRRRSDPAAGRIRHAPDRGMRGFQFGVAAAQRVVFGVGDLRRVAFVIGAVVAGDFGGRAAPVPRRRPEPRGCLRCGFRLAGHAAPSRLSAAARAASVTVSPASMRAISSRRCVAVQRLDAGLARGLSRSAWRPADGRRRGPRPAGCG